ncbi:bidirectional sugar transporter SWEET4-like [Cynara cardunculus var. scolymus]|uniref:bidirectional sugar transporter SWEET4-like n=1 Tax=Cynara cardunculus var. scolymus TaxID=59895 RepID=UPI000D62C972|nr:bidirectional sugar transporter SWEET4-like [Cynara cardunculus var. scolymus]
MASHDFARSVLGVIGNVISIILFLSTVPTFYKIWKKKSVEQYSPVPYLVTFVNCGLWIFYGLPFVHPHSLLVTTTNGAGIVIESVYLLLFIIYSDSKKRIRVILVLIMEIIFLGVLFALTLTLAHGTKLRSAIIGSICIAGNIMMYASPLSVMKMVIKTKSVEYMPFLLSLFCFANGVCWFSYGLIRFDPFVVAPNGIGALFALAQLVLYAIFYKSTQRIMAERQAKGELNLGNVTPSSRSNNSQLEFV